MRSTVAQLRLGRVPGGRVPPAGAGRAASRPATRSPGACALGAHRCADQLRGGRRRGQPAGARVGPGARQVSAVCDYDAFSFSPPRKREQANARSDDEEATRQPGPRVVADKLPLTLDRKARASSPSTTCPRRASRKSCCWKPPTPTPMAKCRPCAAPHAVARRAWWRASRPRAGCRPARRCASRRWRCSTMARPQADTAAGAGHCAHHHHHAQAHGGRLLQLRQPDRNQRPGHRVHRQERQPRACCCARPSSTRPARWSWW
jgi:hypothetical protein